MINIIQEFIDCDPRKCRDYSPINIDTVIERHKVSLPKSLIENKTILDLGSCVSITGCWCLLNGAKHYTGVEVHKQLINISNTLLIKHFNCNNFELINDSISNFLLTNKNVYDIVILFGCLYSFVDIVSVLKKVSEITNQYIIIDSQYPNNIQKDDAVIKITDKQNMHGPIKDSLFSGTGCRISPEFINILMPHFNFINIEGVISDKVKINQDYIFENNNIDKRFIIRLLKYKKQNSLEDKLVEYND